MRQGEREVSEKGEVSGEGEGCLFSNRHSTLTVLILASTSSKKGVHFIIAPVVLELIDGLLLLLKKY